MSGLLFRRGSLAENLGGNTQSLIASYVVDLPSFESNSIRSLVLQPKRRSAASLTSTAIYVPTSTRIIGALSSQVRVATFSLVSVQKRTLSRRPRGGQCLSASSSQARPRVSIDISVRLSGAVIQNFSNIRGSLYEIRRVDPLTAVEWKTLEAKVSLTA